MRGKSLVLIVVALGCGLVASIGISQILDGQGGDSGPAMIPVYVAARDIDLKERITKEMVRVEEWPEDKVTEDAVTDPEQLKDTAAAQRLLEGEMLRTGKLLDPKQGGSIRIPPGFRAQAIKVKPETIAGGLIQPGDHVDVQVYLKKGGAVATNAALTILYDVRVFAVNAQTHIDTDAEGQTTKANTVSLLLKPEQVETILLASQMGQVNLSLRHPEDETKGDVGTQTLRSFLQGGVKTATERQPKVEDSTASAEPSNKNNFKDWLNKMTESASARAAAQQQSRSNSTWEVTLMTPEGQTTYRMANSDGFQSAQMVGAGGYSGGAGYSSPSTSAGNTAAADSSDDMDDYEWPDDPGDEGDDDSGHPDNADAASDDGDDVAS